MKKVVSLLLVLVLALGMSSVAFGANIVGGVGAGSTGNSLSLGAGEVLDTFTDDVVLQVNGNEIDFAIVTIATAGSTDPAIPATYKNVKAMKTTVKASVKSGSKAWDSVAIVKVDKVNAAVRVTLKDPFVSVKDIDIDAVITFYYDGKRSNDTIELNFNYSNNVVEVDTDDDFADIADGSVLHANVYIKLVDVEVGEGVHVWSKVFKDKDYYGVASRDEDERDDVIYAKYPDVDSVVTIQSIGLSSTAQYVTFEDYDDTFWVYGNVDGSIKYLGKSDEKITTFCSKYYLANKELTIDGGDDVEEPDDSDVPEPDEGTGGDDSPANVNDNPGTGA